MAMFHNRSFNRVSSWCVTFFGFALVSFSIMNVSPPATESLDSRSDEYLNVVGTIPLEGEFLQDRIILFFDRPIRIPDNEKWSYFSIEPSRDGDLRIGTNFIVFKPVNLGATEFFTIKLSEKLQSTDGKPIHPQHRTFMIASSNLDCISIWTQEQTENSLNASLVFNYPVDQQELQSRIRIVDSQSNPLEFRVVEGPDQQSFSVLVTNEKLSWPLELTIQQGLPDLRQYLSLPADKKHVFRWEKNLNVNSIQWKTVNQEDQIFEISFDQEIDAAALSRYLRVIEIPTRKEIEFSVLTEGKLHTHAVRVRPTNAQRLHLQVTVKKGLKNEEQYEVPHDHDLILQNNLESMVVENSWWGTYGLRGLCLTLRFNANIRSNLTNEQLNQYVEVIPRIENMQVEFGSWGNEMLQIFGDWKPEFPYEVRIKTGFPYNQFNILQQDIVRQERSDRLYPAIGYEIEELFYFPRRSGIHLPVQSRNVKELTVTVYRLFPSNIAAAIRDINDGQGSSWFNQSWCEQLNETKIPVSGNVYQVQTTQLNLDQLIPEGKRGVFCIETSSGDYPRETKLVVYTDIGLLSHWKNDELAVYAHDLFSLKPLHQAKITVFSNKNQWLGQAETSDVGVAHLKDLNERDGAPSVVVATHGDDYTFLELKNRNDQVAEIDPSMPLYQPDKYDAFVYGDRELYRPGETVHLHWIVRQRYGDAVGDVPLLLKIYKPNRKELLSKPITLTSLGTGGIDVETMKSYPTGLYEATLSVPGENAPIGRYTFRLEEFVPQRLKAELTVSETRWLANQPYMIHLAANHLFGAPAANRRSEARVILKRGAIKLDNWKEFRFENDSEFQPPTIPLGEVWTDEEGKAEYEFQYTPGPEVTVPLTATIVADVFELGGRSVSAKAEAVVFPSDPLLGITAVPHISNKGIDVYVAAVHPDETPAGLDEVTVTLEREVWNYYVRRYRTYNEPNWDKSFQTIRSVTVALSDGRGKQYFEVRDYGRYRVKVHSGETTQTSSLTFYSYGGPCRLDDAAVPTLVKLSLDKPSYSIGEEVKIRVESPFSGKAIVLVQNERIQHLIPVDIVDNVGEVVLVLDESDYPNLWVAATVVHEVKTDIPQVYPFSSFAMKNIKVNHPARKLSVSFPSLPEEIRPSSTVDFQVLVTDYEGNPAQAEVTLAVVDEGVHAITNYGNPDPYGWFARSRRPYFNRAHYYDRVLYDFEKFRPGGGADAALGAMVASPFQNWIKPVALWSGPVKTDDSGHAVIAMEIPEYIGQLRLVAVACTPSAANSAANHVYVRRPYMLRTSVPRFLLVGDTIQGKAILFNQTDQDCAVELTWNASGPIRQEGGTAQIVVPAQGEYAFSADFTADAVMGQGMIQWKAVVKDQNGNEIETLSEDLPIPVYPPATYRSLHTFTVLAPGEEYVFTDEALLANPINSLEVTVSGNPLTRIQEALSYVVGYPYGCVEQTTSRLMPMYLLRKNQALLDKVAADTSVQDYIRVGIERLFAMQTASGGLGSWPGAVSPYEYGSVYALHFLTLVKRDRELPLPQDSFEALQQYVRNLTYDWTDRPSNHYLRAYAMYVLALDGDRESLEQIQRFDHLVIPKSSRYLLAAALALHSKDRKRIEFYLTQAPSSEMSLREQSGTLNSDIRNTAIQLMALRQIDGDKKEIAEKAEELIAFLEHHRYGTTHETAFIVTALADYLSALAEGSIDISAVLSTPTGDRTLQGKDILRDKASGENLRYVVKNTGSSNLYINAVAYGIPKDLPVESVSRGLSITRDYFVDDKKVDGNRFKQGELYVVDVKINPKYDVENLLVADLLPAGFEVENPRLDADAVPGNKFEGAAAPTHLEIRDDKVVLVFDRLSSGEHHFYYIVRAVTTGSYSHPPLQAECMYDPEITASTTPGTIVVQ